MPPPLSWQSHYGDFFTFGTGVRVSKQGAGIKKHSPLYAFPLV